MSQDLTLDFYNGLGRVTDTEADLFWRALVTLKELKSFGLLLNYDERNNAPGRWLLNSVSMLTQIRWVAVRPALLSVHIEVSVWLMNSKSRLFLPL